jgi:hypothetical protein
MGSTQLLTQATSEISFEDYFFDPNTIMSKCLEGKKDK